MSLDKFLWFSLKVLLVVLVIEVIAVIIYLSTDNEEEFDHYMSNPAKRVQQSQLWLG